MNKRTILEIINDIKAGVPITTVEATDTLLALFSLYNQSQMTVETIIAQINNEKAMILTAKLLLGDLEHVRKLRETYLCKCPNEFNKDQKIEERLRIEYYDQITTGNFRS